MATLRADEFQQLIGFLAEEHGLQRLRDKLVRLNALVTRRRATSVEKLANQLYMLTASLRREVPASVAIHSLWAEHVNDRVGEDGEKELGELAEKINACLGEQDEVLAEKDEELQRHLGQYEGRLAAAIGAQCARLDMILKAVPAIADRLRGAPLAAPVTDSASEAAADPGDSD